MFKCSAERYVSGDAETRSHEDGETNLSCMIGLSHERRQLDADLSANTSLAIGTVMFHIMCHVPCFVDAIY